MTIEQIKQMLEVVELSPQNAKKDWGRYKLTVQEFRRSAPAIVLQLLKAWDLTNALLTNAEKERDALAEHTKTLEAELVLCKRCIGNDMDRHTNKVAGAGSRVA